MGTFSTSCPSPESICRVLALLRTFSMLCLLLLRTCEFHPLSGVLKGHLLSPSMPPGHKLGRASLHPCLHFVTHIVTQPKQALQGPPHPPQRPCHPGTCSLCPVGFFHLSLGKQCPSEAAPHLFWSSSATVCKHFHPGHIAYLPTVLLPILWERVLSCDLKTAVS